MFRYSIWEWYILVKMANQVLDFPNLEAVLKQYGEQLLSIYRQKLLQTGSDDTGTLGNTLNYIVEDQDEVYEVSLQIQDYWKYVEEGRNAGKFPPISDIKRWIQTKPVLPRPYNGSLPTIDQLAYLIARKISKRGIEGKHLLEESLTELDAYMLLDDAITKDLETQVDNVFKNF